MSNCTLVQDAVCDAGNCATVTPTVTPTDTPTPQPTATITPTQTPTRTPPACCQFEQGMPPISSCGPPLDGSCGPGTLSYYAQCANGYCITFTMTPVPPTRTATPLPTRTPTYSPTFIPQVDHFKCYKAKPAKTPRFVPLQDLQVGDQFESKRTRVKKPKYLCNPVSKDGSPIERPDQHLVCYSIRDEPRQSRFRGAQVGTRNDLSLLQDLDVVRSKLLCVPSDKVLLLTATPTSPPTRTPTLTHTPTP